MANTDWIDHLSRNPIDTTGPAMAFDGIVKSREFSLNTVGSPARTKDVVFASDQAGFHQAYQAVPPILRSTDAKDAVDFRTTMMTGKIKYFFM